MTGTRPDGYHQIESWVAPVAWFDRLDISQAPRLALEVLGDRDVPANDRNIVWRAAAALADAARRAPAVKIRLRKSIPAGAGLGGGSSDAAATLIGLNTIWNLHWPIARLARLAKSLGADVPLFLHGRNCLVSGIGDRVRPTRGGWRGWLVIFVPPFGLNTASVYQAWSGPGSPPGRARKCAGLRGDSRTVAAALFNDLEPAAFAIEPRLAKLHALIDGLDGRPVRMTGSGSCLFALFDSRSAAASWSKRAAGRMGTAVDLRIVRTL